MSFNFSYNYNEKQGSSFYNMMGLNKTAVDNINESEDICGSYAPDFVIAQDEETEKGFEDDGNSIMNIKPFEEDITALLDDDICSEFNYNI